ERCPRRSAQRSWCQFIAMVYLLYLRSTDFPMLFDFVLRKWVINPLSPIFLLTKQMQLHQSIEIVGGGVVRARQDFLNLVGSKFTLHPPHCRMKNVLLSRVQLAQNASAP